LIKLVTLIMTEYITRMLTEWVTRIMTEYIFIRSFIMVFYSVAIRVDIIIRSFNSGNSTLILQQNL